MTPQCLSECIRSGKLDTAVATGTRLTHACHTSSLGLQPFTKLSMGQGILFGVCGLAPKQSPILARPRRAGAAGAALKQAQVGSKAGSAGACMDALFAVADLRLVCARTWQRHPAAAYEAMWESWAAHAQMQAGVKSAAWTSCHCTDSSLQANGQRQGP